MMGLFGLLKRAANQPAGTAEIVALYQRLRPLRYRLNNQLVQRLSRDALNEGAKKLGILRRGVFVFDNEDESSVLMDYCIYDVYHSGRNAIGQYLEDNSPDPESDEMMCLHAMHRAKYGLVIVTAIEPGVGCHIRNLFTDETRLLVDMGVSRTAQPGLLIATRLLDFGAFLTTSGAALPVGILEDHELEAWKQKLSAGTHNDREDPAPFIRGCLESGASSQVRYEVPNASRRCDDAEDFQPVGISAPPRLALTKRGSNKPAGNRRCRCGSGKMFKNCCGKRERQGHEGR